MYVAYFDPANGRDRLPEEVEVLGPAHGIPDAFVVLGDDSSEMFVAWLDEITWIAEPAELVRA